MGTSDKSVINRRSLFKGAAVAGASSAIPAGGLAQSAAPSGPKPTASPRPSAAEPTAAAMARETEPPKAEPGGANRAGADYMIDAIKQLDIPFCPIMAGSSFRGLQESMINYGGNKAPEILTCLHEEIAVGMCHGYAKATNKPLISMLHGAVGVQHSAMAVYNAWCDRVPMLLIGGNALDGSSRRAAVEWNHSVLDQGATLRDFLKWDAQPVSLPDFNEALKRGYEIATSVPYGPVLIMANNDMQESAISESLRPAPLRMTPTHPVGDPAALEAAGRMLAAASSPVIVADKMARTPAGMQSLIELAELLQCPVIDRGSRLNIPNTHYLAQTELARGRVRAADVILGLELIDPYGTLNTISDTEERVSEPLTGKNFKFIHISTREMMIHSNYQNFQRYQPADLSITGDAEASMPQLIEAVKRAIGSNDRIRIDSRKAKLEAAYKDSKNRTRLASTYGWDATPISTGRISAELYNQLQGHDWTLSAFSGGFLNSWPQKLWAIDQQYKTLGTGSGGGGVGVGGPAGLGAALSHKGTGRIPVTFIGDGDLLVCMSSLWTAAHHQIPILYIVHNNRAYHQELMHVQRMANRFGRGVDTAHIGTTFTDPNIDFAKLAQGYGAVGIGPITDPKDLAPAFKRAIQAVKAGQPVLVDVVSQGR